MKAIKNKIIVEDEIKEQKSSSGIIYSNPVDYKKNTSIGKVISVGEGVTSIKEDDIIMYDSHSGNTREVAGKAYRILSEDCVLAIMDSEDLV